MFLPFYTSMIKSIAGKLIEDVGCFGIYRFTLVDTITKKKRTILQKNLVPTVGRTMIANNLTASSPTNDMQVSHVALGSNTSTPLNTDTTLGTETYRNQVASRTNASNLAYVTGFFSATETSGTYREAGIFCDGSGTANTGVLLSRVSINITKSVTETLTIDWTLTIS